MTDNDNDDRQLNLGQSLAAAWPGLAWLHLAWFSN